METNEPRPSPGALPGDVADAAAERLLAVEPPQRPAVFAALVAEWPEHAAGLARLRDDLGLAEHLLGAVGGNGAPPVTQVGAYRVIRPLGEGAFGVVYLCAQGEPLVRNVAVKVLRPGAGDEQTLRRFAAERQILASLNHPAITQVFDAGVMPDGRPFFVMEHVDGPTIRCYSDERRLDCSQRLSLFVALCRGVAHAHSRGIVHRDLKPSNVLVVDTEAGPTPKIIDFGIAKALAAVAGTVEHRTDPGRVIGTPGYMSPEQAAGRAGEVDERADVFALGVMLYELLVGELPWTRGAAATDTEPVRPSLRITTATVHAARPATERRRLAAALRGDLDWIVCKALARERGERYASVSALTEDLERHLRGEPVSVGPPSPLYRLRKFIRRNRPWVLAAGAAGVVLAAALGFTIAYGSDAQAAVVDAQRSAAASFADAKAILARLIERANDDRLRAAPQGDATRQVLLGDALSFYDRFLQERPSEPGLRAGRCDVLLAISQLHLLLGELPRAASAAAAAVEEARLLVAVDPDAIAWRGLLGEGLRKQGRAIAMTANHAAARTLFVEAATHLAICAASQPADHGRSHAASLREAAITLDDDLLDQRLEELRASQAVLARLRQVTPDDAVVVEDQVQTCLAIAMEYVSARRFEQAGPALAEAAAEVAGAKAGKERLESQIFRLQGSIAWEARDLPTAVQHLVDAVAASTAWLAKEPQRLQPQDAVFRAMCLLAFLRNYTGAFDEASASYREAIAGAERMVAQFPEDPSRRLLLVRTLREYAWTLRDRFRQADLAEAAACVERAIAVDGEIPASVAAGREPRWKLLAMRAMIAESRGLPEGWEDVIAAMPAKTADRGGAALMWIEVCTSLGRWHFANGRFDETARVVELARDAVVRNAPLHDKSLVEITWLQARLAVQRGDHAAAAAAAATIRAARDTWFGVRRAADCLHLAWRCASASDPTSAVANDYRERAARFYAEVREALREDVAKDPDDPWVVVPWASACVRGAELAAAAGDDAAARDLLPPALLRLEAVRGATQADQWDEQVLVDGRLLVARLQVGTGRR